MRSDGWTPLEEAALREAYPLHGAHWEGWADVLPGRSEQAIAVRATRAGIRLLPEVLGGIRSEAATRTARERARASPLERQAMALLAEGLPPSAIDVRLGVEPGTARRAISERWRRSKTKSKKERKSQ